MNQITKKFRTDLRAAWQGLTSADPYTFDDLVGDEPLAQFALMFPTALMSVSIQTWSDDDGVPDVIIFFDKGVEVCAIKCVFDHGGPMVRVAS